ncbi:unnamed protein product [Mytilus coruscus]|uniref:ZMYM2-like/QRICH1 C-terminal domain-containing protein n=1 Tax=Mytilus coruscus TaxID=42192 RepID=A0A6J8E7I7_MYTCO|nr:unnamed protein product [Mytilus coruscus]
MSDDSGYETTDYINSLKNANTIRKTLSDINIFTRWIRDYNDIRTNGKSLIRTVWLNNSLHFGLRSREEHSTIRWGDLQMKSTTDGLQYLEHAERVTKTRTGAYVRETRAFQAKMFADPGNTRCPVEVYKQYIKHRPEDMLEDESPFYLGISRNIKDDIWYSRQPMGKNTLYDFVKVMCEEAGIQGRKTNHSARKTTLHDENMNEIVEMPDDEDEVLMSASQEAELDVVLKDITNFEKTVTDKPNPAQMSNDMPEIIHDNYKERAVQMFAGATITGNVTINFQA